MPELHPSLSPVCQQQQNANVTGEATPTAREVSFEQYAPNPVKHIFSWRDAALTTAMPQLHRTSQVMDHSIAPHPDLLPSVCQPHMSPSNAIAMPRKFCMNDCFTLILIRYAFGRICGCRPKVMSATPAEQKGYVGSEYSAVRILVVWRTPSRRKSCGARNSKVAYSLRNITSQSVFTH